MNSQTSSNSNEKLESSRDKQPESSSPTSSPTATDSELDEPQLDSGSGSGSAISGNGGDGPGNRQPDDGEGKNPEGSRNTNPVMPEEKSQLEQVNHSFKKIIELPAGIVSTVTRTAYGFLTDRVKELLHFVPVPVIVALISTVSTISGTRYNARRNKMAAIATQQKAARAKKDEIERLLRKKYMELSAPILKSAAKLADRIHSIVDSDWDRVEKKGLDSSLSPAYSAYLLGRYFAMVEIIKQESVILDYGFHAADRVLSNILGRIQGVFAASDEILIEMQMTEHLFHPPDGQTALRAGPLRVTPRAQAVLGELLHRKLYSGKLDFVDKAENERRGQDAVLSFREFSRILEVDATVARWYKPVIRDFETLEAFVRRTSRSKRRCDRVGSRLYFAQSALMDLVEFFDPLPQAHAIPFYRRRRLQLGGVSYSEEQRAPLSLHLLYRELAKIRDRRSMVGSKMDRLRLPRGGVEVHVKGSQAHSNSDTLSQKYGDCPYSQRVLILLEELGVPYQAVAIPPMSKPGWYYLLHPDKRTPVVYHNGNLVEDSRHIMTYIKQHFRPAEGKRRLSSAKVLTLPVSTATYIKFHGHFLNWVSGQEDARGAVEEELRKLNGTVARAQRLYEKGSFLGGCQFAREDTAIAPMLHNVVVAGKALKNWELPEDCKALRKYEEDARKVPSFAKTVGADEAIVAGYRCLAKRGGEKVWALADMLE
ncbi:unnamed protein product [Chondrus crispus]|uniref:GST N-terminal domain-containing protein n=1 Tax=Chondrus crispus TaxID=2769 RepID=R7QRY8_CHOCR|nr:unnamed protein product [Chondrus crispus]CDF40140.1 unnamed protein product [Chondrus crispus]|eukprot:XP_005710434.1 unnamed protein product [Chondrus crispus]